MVVITDDRQEQKVRRRTFRRPFVSGAEDTSAGLLGDCLSGRDSGETEGFGYSSED